MKRVAGLLLLSMLVFIASAQRKTERPKLVVGVCVDQLRWDYLHRFYDRFGTGGFQRLMEEGYSYENAFINYAPSVTAAGHASIYTGTTPALHGIAGNDWITDVNNLQTNAVKDTIFKTIGSNSDRGKAAPLKLLSTTIGDELRLSNHFASRVYSIAWKDRASVIPGGRGANAAYWFDDKTGKWVSSSYYMNTLPGWLEDYNSKLNADSLMGISWSLIKPAASYVNTGEDAASWERNFPGESRPAFPHSFSKDEKGGYSNLGLSPQSQKLSFDLARSLIEDEKMGAGRYTDMLCLSLSTLDQVGHLTAPNSLEIEDLMIRLDQELGRFIRFLDKTIGQDNYLIFLTSDHGVAHSTGFMIEKKLSAGNLPLRSMVKEWNDSCYRKFGVEPVLNVLNYQVYLDEEKIRRTGNDISLVEKYIMQNIRKREEVLQVFSYREMEKVILPEKVMQMFVNGYVAGRSGDIQIILKPGFTDRFSQGGDHASWYNYDTKIPVLIYGWHIPVGRSYRRISITDIAPTISALLGIQPPSAATGEVLVEVVR